MSARKKNAKKLMVISAAVAAVTSVSLAYAGTSTVPVGNATSLRRTTAASPDVPTISISGSTAMRNFTISPGFTLLSTVPGSTITLGGPVANPSDALTYTLGDSAVLQFAQQDFNALDSVSTTGITQSHSALRVEWHEQGSVEGIIELADGQINDNIQGNTLYNPTVANPTWINRNKFTIATTLGGHQLVNNANDTTRAAMAQSNVQMAISDVTATQGFAKGGIANNNNGAYTKTPSDPGYGMGNKYLPVGALGTPGARFQLQKEEVLNMTAGAADPNGGSFSTGAWNTAGVGNLNSKAVAVTATLFTANPGTGLTHVNRTDTQWLQMAGRLKNGADFNMTTRDVGSGTRNVAALNTGVDPSWAVGENDAGNGNNATGATDQTAIGSGITFSNKTAGGGQLRPTVQRSRMAVGTLSMSDGIGSFTNSNATPLRALDYRDDADDLSNNSNGAGWKNWNEDGSHNPVFTSGDLASNTFIRASATSITNGSYVIFQNEQYVTVRKPDADYNTDKVKGDDAGHDVQDVRDNIFNSALTFGAASSVATPADSLIDNSFILPQFMLVNKPVDGLNQSAINGTYQSGTRNTFLGDTRASKFNPADPSTIKAGASARYGANAAHVTLNPDGSVTNTAPAGGAITITTDNYFFGDFKRDNADPNTGNRDVRDFSDLAVAQKAQAALKLGGSTTWDDAGDLNSRVVSDGGGFTFTGDMAFTPTKGDLIALGDFNSDGKFDGKDLYLMAHGTALADNTSSTTLSGGSNAFGDKVRSGVLRKNAALDSLASSATAQQRIDASVNLTNDPTGANAFNKRDVNRDGLVNFVDCLTSDKFFNKSYTDIDNALSATANVRDWESVTPFNLVDAELNDTGNIDQTDLDVINTSLTGNATETWTTGTLIKSGAGAVSVAYMGTASSIKVNSGATLMISAGTVDAGGTVDPFTDNTGTGTNGNYVAVINNATSSLIVSAGGKSIATLSGVGNTSVSAGASLTTDYARQNQLTVNGNVNIRSAGAPNTRASIVNTLAIGPAGKLDLANQDLIAHATPVGTWNGSAYTDLTGQIASGRNGTAWNGPGIITSQSNAQNSNFTALGIARASDILPNSASETAVWNGQTITGTDTLVMYTYVGDATLNGKLNIDDYVKIDSGIAGGYSGWSNGDFNYDGKVSINDYITVIDANLGTQGASLAGGSGIADGPGISGVTALPEPGAAVGLIGAMAALSLRHGSRRRRR